jgi:ankyrin repeat protein
VGTLGVVVLIAVIVLRAVLPSQQRVNASMHTATGQTPTVQPVQPTQSVIAVSAADRAAATPQKLQRAILSGDEAQVRALLAANPPLAGAVGKKGWTPLHYAAYAGKADIAEMFCTAGADVNAKTEDGSAPLHLAAQEGHAAVTRTLLAHGANVNAQETQGWTPLHFTAQEGHVDVATLLIDGGADINSRDHAGRTPLAVALKVNKLFVVDLLRQRGGQN